MMNFTQIHYHHVDRTAIITISRPEKRNALNDVMVSELTAGFVAAARDATVKVVQLKAQGTAFCAGADIEYVQRIAQSDLEQNRTDSHRLAYLFRTMYELRKPVIAVVQGPAIAGGCGLATACDFVLAGERESRFGYPEVQMGFAPAIVMTFLIKRVGEGRAREITVRGDLFGAARAMQLGLLTEVIPDERLDAAADALASELATRNSATSMGYCKELTTKLQGLNLVDGLDFAANVNAAARMTADCRKGLDAFLHKTTPEW